MHRRCERNRKRSKRRKIYCPIHKCYLNSVSPKYLLLANRAGQLQKRGVTRRNALLLLATKPAVSLKDEWLEAFWCDQCKETKWYYVQKGFSKTHQKEICTYKVSVVSPELWQQAIGVIDSEGNPSVGEFTRRHARKVSYTKQ